MALKSACPSANQLEQIMRGKVEPVEVERIAQHVETCADCVQTLQSLRGDDTLAAQFRAEAGQIDKPVGEAVRKLMERMRRNDSRSKATAESAVDQTVDATPNPAAPSSSGANQFSWVESPRQASDDEDDGLAPPQAADEIGRLGPYRVLKVLGEGGMGKVFLAEDPALERQVALKVMKKSLAVNRQSRERFKLEARAAAKIEHDNIIPIYQVSEDHGVPFVAMPLLKGASLEDLLRKKGALQPKQVLRIGIQIAEGLAAAHASNLIHRDIKPGNIWIEPTGGGRVKILDFGLARSTQSDAGITQSGAILGTPAYMPPEQARGEKVDTRADLYSLGCVLYRMATGEMPLKGNDTMSLLLALATQEPIAPIVVKGDVPKGLSDLIMRLMAKDPTKRPSSAKETAQALRSLDHGDSSTSIAAPPPPAKAVAPVKPPNPFANLRDATEPVKPGPSPSGKGAGGEGTTPRKSRHPLVLIACAAAFALCLALAGGIIYIVTDYGTIEIGTWDDNVKVTVLKNGQLVDIFDPNSKRTWTLNTGMYTLKLKDDPDGFEIVAPRDGKFEMKRGGVLVVSIRKRDVAALTKGEPKNNTKVYPASEPKLIATLQNGGSVVRDMAFTPDGMLLVPSVQTRELKLHNPRKQSLERVVLKDGGIRWMALSSDGNTAVCQGDLPSGPAVWSVDVVAGKKTQSVALDHTETGPAITLDGKTFAYVSKRGDGKTQATLQLANAQTGEKGYAGPIFSGYYPHALKFSSDGSRIIGVDHSVYLFILDAKTLTEAAKAVEAGWSDWVDVTSDGWIAVCPSSGDDLSWRLYDLKGNMIHRETRHTAGSEAGTLSPNGNYLALGDKAGFVHIWSIRDKKELVAKWSAFDGTLKPYTQLVSTLAFSRDGKMLAAAGRDGVVKVWDVENLLVSSPVDLAKSSKSSAPPRSPNDGGAWVQLFNGKDLTGWKKDPLQRGDWKVEGGAIVGTSGHSYLFTEMGDYDNFHARVKAKLNQGGNSGLFFRAPFELKAGYPHAYEAQFEICNHPLPTGSLWPFKKADKIVPIAPDTWFTIDVIAQDNHIIIKVNGETTLDYLDAERRYRKGHLAIQCDSENTVVRVQSIEVKKLPDELSTWMPLFNGKDTQGWHLSEGAKTNCQVEGGVLTLSGETGFLVTDRRDYENCRIRVEARIAPGGDSGVCFRVQDEKVERAYEAQIGAGLKGATNTGSLCFFGANYHEMAFAPNPIPPGQWFTMEILVEDHRFTIWVDGKQTIQHEDKERSYQRGSIALQHLRVDANAQVSFRKVEIKSLPGLR